MNAERQRVLTHPNFERRTSNFELRSELVAREAGTRRGARASRPSRPPAASAATHRIQNSKFGVPSSKFGRASARTRAFTLMEITVAIGLFAFAIVGIFGLLPVALNTSAETRYITYATQIAKSSLADLRSLPFNATGVRADGVDINDLAAVDLATPGTLYFACDSEGRPTGVRTETAFEEGSPGDAYLVRVQWFLQETAPPRLAQVNVDVDYPGGAEEDLRRRQTFATLITE